MLLMVVSRAFYIFPSIVSSGAYSGPGVIRVLFRDYLIYFIVMVGFWGTDLGLLASHNITIGALAISPTQAVAAILGTRLLLNLTIANAKEGVVCTFPPTTGGMLEFRRGTDIGVFTETSP